MENKLQSQRENSQQVQDGNNNQHSDTCWCKFELVLGTRGQQYLYAWCDQNNKTDI